MRIYQAVRLKIDSIQLLLFRRALTAAFMDNLEEQGFSAQDWTKKALTARTAARHTVLYGSTTHTSQMQQTLAARAAQQGACIWVVGQTSSFLNGFASLIPTSKWITLSPNSYAGINIFQSEQQWNYDSLSDAVAHLSNILDIPEAIALEAISCEIEAVGLKYASFISTKYLAKEICQRRKLPASNWGRDSRTVNWYAEKGLDAYQGWNLSAELTDAERAHAVRLALLRIANQTSRVQSNKQHVVCVEDSTWLMHLNSYFERDLAHARFSERQLRQFSKYGNSEVLTAFPHKLNHCLNKNMILSHIGCHVEL